MIIETGKIYAGELPKVELVDNTLSWDNVEQYITLRGGDKRKVPFEKGSDIDLAVWGLDENETRELKIQLNEYTNLPHKFDVIRFESLNNPELKQHIIDFGKTIFPFRRKQRSDPATPTG